MDLHIDVMKKPNLSQHYQLHQHMLKATSKLIMRVRISLDTLLIQAASVDLWEDLPQLLDRLAQMADDTLNNLQVMVKGSEYYFGWVQTWMKQEDCYQTKDRPKLAGSRVTNTHGLHCLWRRGTG